LALTVSNLIAMGQAVYEKRVTIFYTLHYFSAPGDPLGQISPIWEAMYSKASLSICRISSRSDNPCVRYMLPIFINFVDGVIHKTQTKLEMWANAQRDGRPAEYRWCPLFNAAVWLTPTTRVPCSNAAKTRNPLKLPGVPQTNERISAAGSP